MQQACDFGVPSRLCANSTVVITITDMNDNRPVFAATSLACHMPENARTLTVCTRVSATDADLNNSSRVSYRILTGNVAGVFAVDPDKGYVYTIGALDRETTAEYILTIQAFDHGTDDGFFDLESANVSTVTVTIDDINDNPPVFTASTQVTVSLSEDVPIGTHVFTVHTTDADVGVNGVDGHTFALLRSKGAFTINASGAVLTSRLLDREQQDAFVFWVEARDAGGLRATLPVVVNITDVNDCAPTFGQAEYVASPSPFVMLTGALL